jgi:hypothetical protein
LALLARNQRTDAVNDAKDGGDCDNDCNKDDELHGLTLTSNKLRLIP